MPPPTKISAIRFLMVVSMPSFPDPVEGDDPIVVSALITRPRTSELIDRFAEEMAKRVNGPCDVPDEYDPDAASQPEAWPSGDKQRKEQALRSLRQTHSYFPTPRSAYLRAETVSNPFGRSVCQKSQPTCPQKNPLMPR